jgi:hypothetical protein
MAKEIGSNTKIPRGRRGLGQKVLYEEIEKKAYELYIQRGGEPGKAMDDWLEAERIVLGKRRRK